MPQAAAAKQASPSPPPQPAGVESQTPVPSSQKNPLIWVYGVNAHLANVELPPPGFTATGNLRIDFTTLCAAIGAVPHPVFKPKPPASKKREGSSSRKTSKSHGGIGATPEPPNPVMPREETRLRAASILMDNPSMRVFSFLLPTTQNLKVIIFSECSLDMEMLGLLRAGLVGNGTVESLQVEWNPFELPLPSLEDCESLSQKSQEAESEDAYGPTALNNKVGGGETDIIEARERRRYLLQSQRSLSSFKDWIVSVHGGDLSAALNALGGDGDLAEPLPSVEFYNRVEAKLGISGQHIFEVFDVLDGPDYSGSEGKVSLASLKDALEQLPALPDGQQDPIGATLASFLEGDCTLDSLSFRACAVAWPELASICQALVQGPWQLRALNLWENRICDRGAELIAAACEDYRGLEYLGLGRNRITDSGFQTVCRPFNHAVVSEAGLAAAKERVSQQQAQLTAMEKEKAKQAKAKPKPDAAKKKVLARPAREPIFFVSSLEDVPGDGGGDSGTPPSWLLKRRSEIRVLNVAENPIKQAKVVESLQALGPPGAELVIRGTPAAAAMLKAGVKERRSSVVAGWQLRLT